MSAEDPSWFLGRARGRSLEDILQEGIGGSLLALAGALIDMIVTGGQVVVQPMAALAEGAADLTSALIGGPAEILWAGIEATADSILTTFNVGPLSFALSVGAVLAGLWVYSRYRDEEDTGNLIPGIPFDVPIIGEVEEDED